MRELTKRQSEIYDYIKHVVQTKGYPPSVREIGEAVGLASVQLFMVIYLDWKKKDILNETLRNREPLKLLANKLTMQLIWRKQFMFL